MKITEMHITPVAISDPPLLNSVGIHQPYALRTIVELVSDDGLYGLGEVPGNVTTNAALEEARRLVIGKDPFQMNVIEAALEDEFGERREKRDASLPWDHRTVVHVRSAIEVACFDLMGKATGRSVADLLGGAVRDRVPFAAYLFFKREGAGGKLGFGTDPTATGWDAARQAAALTPEGVVAEAQAMCAEFGFKAIKLKAGVFPPDEEVAAMLALREAFGPETPLRIDPNAVWSVETSIQVGKQLEGVLEYLEDPTRGQEWMAQVAKAVRMPLATNMCTTSFEDLPNSIAIGSEAVILSDHHFWGGLRPSVELAAICRTFGRGLSMHSNSHLGISLAAMVQLAAAVPNLTYSLDTHYPWQYEEVILGGRFRFEDGSVEVSTAPGLGIELDRAALAKLHEQYAACGITERDDTTEMQKLDPSYKKLLTRW